MRHSFKLFIHCLVLIGFLLTLTATAIAIPAFARKYRVSCSTCHLAAPKLKAFGEDFAGNGFIFPDSEEPKRAYIDTGDDELQLMRELPIAVRFDAFVQTSDRDEVKSDLQTPYGVKLLSGGSITPNVAYYMYFYMSERGEVAGLEDAYVHFNNIGGVPFDIMVGQFQVSDPLFKRELKLTFEDYQIYKLTPGDARANLTYDRGLMLTYGFDFGLDVVGEIVNGTGIGEGENRLLDFDSAKNYMLRGSQNLGPLRVGAFGYLGEEDLSTNQTNQIVMWGPDATFTTDNFEVNAQYLQRTDDNAFLGFSNMETTFNGGLIEAAWFPQGDRSKWMLTGLYNWIKPDEAHYLTSPFEYETATLSVSHMAARNLRVLFEGTYDRILEQSRLTVGFVSAF